MLKRIKNEEWRGSVEEGKYLRCSHEKASSHCLKIEFTDKVVVATLNDIIVRKSIGFRGCVCVCVCVCVDHRSYIVRLSIE